MSPRKPTELESPGLRQRIIDAAGRIFVEEGYDHLSMRHVAQVAGCSQMAAYRHFANKEALTQHLCAQLYTDFTSKMFRQMEAASEAWEQIRIFVTALLNFAVTYPDHYSLVFLIRHSDEGVIAEREQLGEQFLQAIHALIRKVLPDDTPVSTSNMRMRQVLTCLHGTAALLIAHPRAYGLSKPKAIKDAEDAITLLLRV
ncbi:TetR/AcrR family transcriptional regulator [Terriglobus tenax]|uniref:TetR/AcrR family transcriptional regulator n=1 Tax=Terriglobus tenax TaxID=1111115 RepID=UPI0021E08F5F|nr:TetR/AcrR family transcriptional regulator [Terriglobus tenax]